MPDESTDSSVSVVVLDVLTPKQHRYTVGASLLGLQPLKGCILKCAPGRIAGVMLEPHDDYLVAELPRKVDPSGG